MRKRGKMMKEEREGGIYEIYGDDDDERDNGNRGREIEKESERGTAEERVRMMRVE